MSRFPGLMLGQRLTETWTVTFEPVGGGEQDVRCTITTAGAGVAVGRGTVEMDAALNALHELRSDLEDRDEGLIAVKDEQAEAWKDLAEVAYGSRDAAWTSYGTLVKTALSRARGETL